MTTLTKRPNEDTRPSGQQETNMRPLGDGWCATCAAERNDVGE